MTLTGWGPCSHRTSISVVMRVELTDTLAGEAGRKLVEATHAYCPYSKATRGNIDVELVIE